MEESESLIAYAVTGGSDQQKSVAQSLKEQYQRYVSWEGRHSNLMRRAGDAVNNVEQVYDLRALTLQLVANGAVTRYLRNTETTGKNRKALIEGLHPHQDYVKSIVQEHSRYLRSEASSMCARFIARKLGDPRVGTWFSRYRDLYDEYFAMYAERVIAERRGFQNPLSVFMMDKKKEIYELRKTILVPPSEIM